MEIRVPILAVILVAMDNVVFDTNENRLEYQVPADVLNKIFRIFFGDAKSISNYYKVIHKIVFQIILIQNEIENKYSRQLSGNT